MSPLAAVAAAVDGECSDIGDMASGGVAAAGFLADFDAAVFGAVAIDASRRAPVADVCNISGSPREPLGDSTAAPAPVFPPPDAFRADPVADGVSMAASGPLVDAFAVFGCGVVAPVGVAVPGVTFVALPAPSVPDGTFAAFAALRAASPVSAAVAVSVVPVGAAPAFAAFAGAAVFGPADLTDADLVAAALAGALPADAVPFSPAVPGPALAAAALLAAALAGAVSVDAVPLGPALPGAALAAAVLADAAPVAAALVGAVLADAALVAAALVSAVLAGVALVAVRAGAFETLPAGRAAVPAATFAGRADLAGRADFVVSLVPRVTVFAGPVALVSGLDAAALVGAALPAVAVPAVALPAVALPAVALPAVALPAVTLPAVAFAGAVFPGAADFAVRAVAFAGAADFDARAAVPLTFRLAPTDFVVRPAFADLAVALLGPAGFAAPADFVVRAAFAVLPVAFVPLADLAAPPDLVVPAAFAVLPVALVPLAGFAAPADFVVPAALAVPPVAFVALAGFAVPADFVVRPTFAVLLVAFVAVVALAGPADFEVRAAVAPRPGPADFVALFAALTVPVAALVAAFAAFVPAVAVFFVAALAAEPTDLAAVATLPDRPGPAAVATDFAGAFADALPAGVEVLLAFAGAAAFADVLADVTFDETTFAVGLFAGMLFAPDLTDAFTALLLPGIAVPRTEPDAGFADFVDRFVAPFADPGSPAGGRVVFLTPRLFVLLGAWIAAPAGDAADRAPDETPRTTPASPAMASPKCKTGAWRTATHC